MAKERLIDLAEAHSVIRRFRLIAVTAATLIAGGSVFYHHVEGWRWLDSVYFSVVSLLTVGYGDITPKTDLGKLFTMGYLIVGVGVLASFANIIVKGAVARRRIKTDQDGS